MLEAQSVTLKLGTCKHKVVHALPGSSGGLAWEICSGLEGHWYACKALEHLLKQALSY